LKRHTTLIPTFRDSLSGPKLYSIGLALLLGSLTQASLGAQPGVVSSTPATGTGFRQTFTFVYSDAGGYANLNAAGVNFSSPLSGANACYVGLVLPSLNSIVLLNDAGTGWIGGALGTSGSIQNNQCSINLAGQPASGSGNNLTWILDITFSSSFAGTKTIWMDAADSGSGTPWVNAGTWTVGNPTVPSAVSVAPSSGSGFTQPFSFVYSDTGGWANLAWTQLLFGSTLNGFNACYAYYNVAGNWISLDGDNNNWGSAASLGPGGTVQNSQCSVNATASSFSASGNNLTLNLAITFFSSFAGVKNTYMIAQDNDGITSQWLPAGTWTVGNPPVPSVVSSTPATGAGFRQTFTFVYSDTGGYANLNAAGVNFSSPLSGANACYVGLVLPSLNSIVLLNDAGTGWIGGALGTSGSIQNSQCSINLAGQPASGSGNNLTWILDITFSSSFAGTKTIWMDAADSGSGTPWVNAGTWTVSNGVLTLKKEYIRLGNRVIAVELTQ
jgi:hypothetical protein